MPTPDSRTRDRDSSARRRAERRRRQVRRRRTVAGLVVLALVGAVTLGFTTRSPGDEPAGPTATPVVQAAKPAPKPAPRAKPAATRLPAATGRPSDKARLELREVITGNISPKSVASSGNGLRDRAEHDVPPHGDRLRRAHAEARQDDPGQPCAFAARLSAVPGHRPRRAGRGRVLAGRPLRVRLELLDVRRGLRPGGQRRVHAVVRVRPQLRSTASTWRR